MYELLIRGGNVVFPARGVEQCDIAINGERIVALGTDLGTDAHTVVDAAGRHVFPGVIDSHFHLGIFRPLGDDARSESLSAAAGGVTSILIYYRGGRNNLLEDTDVALPPAYEDLFPRVLEQSAGNFWCDYGYNLAPVSNQHVAEIPGLVAHHGVTTFKFYMHYQGVRPGEPAPPKEYVYTDSGYGLAHLLHIMQAVAATGRGRVSVHAENPAIVHAGYEEWEAGAYRDLPPLAAYSAIRPDWGERLAILEVAELAHRAGCPVNILHVSSAAALDAVQEARHRYPELDILAEATVHHLLLTNEALGVEARVNPPIRAGADRERLWLGIERGEVQTIVSDHAAIDCAHKQGDLLEAWYGFGGTELLLPAAITEGHVRRGLPLERLAELLSLAPARHHGLAGRKGDIAVGMDADLAIVDIGTYRTVDHTALHSAQDFSPFDGADLTGWNETTVLRGAVVYDAGRATGERRGRFLARPAQ